MVLAYPTNFRSKAVDFFTNASLPHQMPPLDLRLGGLWVSLMARTVNHLIHLFRVGLELYAFSSVFITCFSVLFRFLATLHY